MASAQLLGHKESKGRQPRPPDAGQQLSMKLKLDLALTTFRLALPGALRDPIETARRLTPKPWTQGSPSYRQVQQVAWITDRLARLIRPSKPCLPRALLRYRALRRLGEPAVLHVGLSRWHGTLRGHAWVAVHNVPFFENVADTSSYSTFLRYPQDE
jgi:hypothetical protein